MSTDVEKNSLREENELLKRQLNWYRNTYDNRSVPGLLKQGMTLIIDKTRTKMTSYFLARNSIKKKYVLSYLLIHIRDKGVVSFLRSTFGAFKIYGIEVLTDPRAIVLQKIRSERLKHESFFYQVPSSHEIDEGLLLENLTKMTRKPLVSFIMPTYNTKPELLRIAINSIRKQIYGNWELCIVDDCSSDEDTLSILRSFEGDKRIKIAYQKKNEGISLASNRAIKMAKGEFIALMDHDDEITPDASYWIINELNQFPNTDIIYTDESKVDEEGNLSEYFLKPDWSPELMFNMMYSGHLTVYRRDYLLSKVGLFRKEYDFSQDYDLMLRASEGTKNIRHIKKVLYHWRITQGSSSQGDKPYARLSNLAALADAMKRRNVDVEIIELPTANRVKLKLKTEVPVSLIVPTDSYENLNDTIQSVLENTNYDNYEIVAVTNSALIARMKSSHSYPKVLYIPYDKPYTFSDKCNYGAQNCNGDIVIFFNDDVRPISKDWISDTIEYLFIDGVGGVSPKLIYENDTIQYAGMATGVRNLSGTTFHCYHKDTGSYFNFVQSVRNVSILSGACLAMKKDVFFKVGSFDVENTPTAHSDVDLSFKIIENNYRCVYTPHAVLRHIGHHSLKEYDDKIGKFKKERSDVFLLKRWSKYLGEDPFFTEPMKTLLYHDSPEYYKVYGTEVQRNIPVKSNVILVSHDLTLSGAPIMLYEICKILKKQGYFIVVFSPSDGPLRTMLLKIGVDVIIDELVLRQHDSFYKFAKNFDLIICNTIVSWPVVRQMKNTVKTIWWIHEGKLLDLFTGNSDFVDTLKRAPHIIGVSDYSIKFLEPYNQNIFKIYNGCKDIYNGEKHKSEKLIISLIGSMESRKGHDILINALDIIDPSLLQEIEVRFIGRILEVEFYEHIKTISKNKPFIKFYGERSHQDCLTLLRQSDLVLNVSRDDPFPVVLVEAFCCAKTCIVSSNSGLEELISDGDNGYVFHSEDTADLAQKISIAIKNGAQLDIIGERARNTYLQHLSIEGFSRKIKKYLELVESAELV